jgi:rhodanese-related sulfurtransferase
MTGAELSNEILPLEITPQEVKERLDSGEKLVLIDVREPSEFQQTRIEGAELIPMRTVPAELSRLEARSDDGALIVFCHHGVRSLNVVHWLREQGLSECQSMAGGIDRWSREIDPLVPRYS